MLDFSWRSTQELVRFLIFDDDILVVLHEAAGEVPFLGPEPVDMRQPRETHVENVHDASVSGKNAAGAAATAQAGAAAAAVVEQAPLYSLWNLSLLSRGW